MNLSIKNVSGELADHVRRRAAVAHLAPEELMAILKEELSEDRAPSIDQNPPLRAAAQIFEIDADSAEMIRSNCDARKGSRRFGPGALLYGPAGWRGRAAGRRGYAGSHAGPVEVGSVCRKKMERHPERRDEFLDAIVLLGMLDLLEVRFP